MNIQAKGVKPIMADSSELPVIKPNDDVYMIHHPGQMKKHYSQDNVKLVIKPFMEYLAGTLEGPPGSPVFVLKESKFLLVAMQRKKNAVLVSKILDGIDGDDIGKIFSFLCFIVFLIYKLMVIRYLWANPSLLTLFFFLLSTIRVLRYHYSYCLQQRFKV